MNTEADFINIFRSDLEIEIKNKVVQYVTRELRIADTFCFQRAVFSFSLLLCIYLQRSKFTFSLKQLTTEP